MAAVAVNGIWNIIVIVCVCVYIAKERWSDGLAFGWHRTNCQIILVNRCRVLVLVSLTTDSLPQLVTNIHLMWQVAKSDGARMFVSIITSVQFQLVGGPIFRWVCVFLESQLQIFVRQTVKYKRFFFSECGWKKRPPDI